MNRTKKTLVALVALVAAAVAPASAFAASDYSGRIGRIDVRTGYASTSSYRHGLVIRGSDQGVVCVMDPGSEHLDQFLSVATTAMLSGRNVVIARGGTLNGQFKCYQIQVRE